MENLLSNLPVEDLRPENDYLGLIEKADLIKYFLESTTEQTLVLKMFALYGPWGSGKSTLMKYLKSQANEKFNTYFFEAWEFEKDLNLPVSLLEFLTSKNLSGEDVLIEDLLDVSSKLFRGIIKSLTIKTPIIDVSGEKITAEFEKEDERSFITLREEFKTKFRTWEDKVTSKNTPEYNLVLIDDLDRCEPENVLDLLSSIKLFFTYGKKTIFLFGVDKQAVSQAIKAKYSGIVKSHEYLEKVFDVSFTMPNTSDITKLLGIYFPDRSFTFQKNSIVAELNNFFVALDETNPRRIKKVLNKFQILVAFIKYQEEGQSFYNKKPNVLQAESGNFGETIIVLYMIILHEFHKEIFDQLFDLKSKEYNYIKAIENNRDLNEGNKNTHRSHIRSRCRNTKLDLSFENFNEAKYYEYLVFLFAPNQINILSHDAFELPKFEQIIVDNPTIEYRLIKYLNIRRINHLHFENPSKCSLGVLKRLIASLL